MKRYKYSINGSPYEVKIKKLTGDHAVVEVNGTEYDVEIIEEPRQRKTPQLVRPKAIPQKPERSPSKTQAPTRPTGTGSIKAPLPGLVLEVLVKEGDQVEAGKILMKMEAMKMENNIQSTRSGTVLSIKVKPGDSVLEGDVLLEIGG
ncbi:acetyl-CoA carboxylase biotin carboxyl carrier protein subunit [candidate division KSB1 bacterium 4484_87]|nr:MAG: acetyl-CoA carboxylase biotin carboxyl carrier protein subunit [candidate division KSB1 bacterium 4484_87]